MVLFVPCNNHYHNSAPSLFDFSVRTFKGHHSRTTYWGRESQQAFILLTPSTHGTEVGLRCSHWTPPSPQGLPPPSGPQPWCLHQKTFRTL